MNTENDININEIKADDIDIVVDEEKKVDINNSMNTEKDLSLYKINIDMAIKLIGNAHTVDVTRLKDTYNNYMIAKKSQRELIDFVKERFSEINRVFVEEGLEPPFIIGENDLKSSAIRASIKELESQRDDAYLMMHSLPGQAHYVSAEKQAEAKKLYDMLESRIKTKYSELETAQYIERMSKDDPKKFNATINSLEYLNSLVEKGNNLLEKQQIRDENTTLELQDKISFAMNRLKKAQKKQNVIDESVKAFKDVEESLGVKLDYDESILNNKEQQKKELAEKKNVEETKQNESEIEQSNAQNTQKGEVQKSSIPSGRRKVTKIRNAKLSPFVKSILLSTAVSAPAVVGLGIGTAISLPTVVMAAGLGIAAQAIYRKIAKNNPEATSELLGEKYIDKHPADVWGAVTAIHAIKKPFLDLYTSAKAAARKRKEEKEARREAEAFADNELQGEDLTLNSGMPQPENMINNGQPVLDQNGQPLDPNLVFPGYDPNLMFQEEDAPAMGR